MIIRRSLQDDRLQINEMLTELDLGYKGQSFDDIWVAEEDGKIVGIAELKEYDDYFFLSSVGTLQAVQGSGVATRLLNKILRQLDKPVYLYTIIPEFFVQLAFKPIDFLEKLPTRAQYNCAACQSAKCVCMILGGERMRRYFFCLSVALIAVVCAVASYAGGKKQGADASNFVDITTVIPSVVLDIRYATPHNFIGEKIRGYDAPKCMLTRPAANALALVQKELEPFAMSLKLYDCYRPQRSVDHFVEWAKDLKDERMKKEFYPSVEKKNLFRDGYIALESSHSRGSTVDLTIVARSDSSQGDSIDMGTEFDFFGPLSHTANPSVGIQQKLHRLLLKTLMEKNSFVNYDKEWWHYTLKNEPYPKTYFDIPVN